jgi:hypothetical protein
MKSLAVIPVHGRLSLLKITIQRLFYKNNVDHIICVGDTDEEKQLCQRAGAEFITFPNKPLGKKWNAGFLRAKDYNPDVVVYVGSADWLSDNWVPVMMSALSTHSIIGKQDYNMLHYSSGRTVAFWPGYPLGSGRELEPIGIGRLLSNDFLDKVEWQPFDDYLNKSMDYSMMFKLMKIGGSCFLFNSPEIQSLSVSCDKWSNMHNSDFNSGVIRFRQPDTWLSRWFPEALTLEL